MTGEVVEGEIVKAEIVGGPAVVAEPRRPLNVLAVVSVALLLTVGVLGTLLVRQRSAQDEERRHLGNQAARSAQRAAALNAELAAVRAQRDEAVSRLARADALGLSPEAIAAIRACVRHYAELERAPGGIASAVGLQPACTEAEPYLR